MKRFAQLYAALDATTRTTAKTAALVDYFADAPAADSAWVIYFLGGQKLQRIVPMKLLRMWSTESTETTSTGCPGCQQVDNLFLYQSRRRPV